MAIVVQKTFDLSSSGEVAPVLRTIDPAGQVARRPSYSAPVFGSVTQVQTANFGDLFSQSVSLVSGSATPGLQFYKIDGPHEVLVNPGSGEVTWLIPSAFNGTTGFRGRAVRIGIRAVNGAGFADLYFIVVVGTSNILYVGPGETYTSIQAAMPNMVAGDTMIIRDGTYTGDENTMNYGEGPPGGAQSQFTSIIAETPFGVVLDAENARDMLTHSSDYVAPQWNWGSVGPVNRDFVMYDGLEIINGRQGGYAIRSSQYVYLKMISTTHSGTPSLNGAGTTSQSIIYSDHILMEDCIADGHHRLPHSPWRCTNIVFKRLVGRVDIHSGSNPVGGISAYTNRDFSGFNCISVDSDSNDWWTAHTYFSSAFGAPATGEYDYPRDNEFRKCIAVNCAYSTIDAYTDGNAFLTVFQDIVGWNNMQQVGPDIDNLPGSILCRGSLDIDNVTMGRSATPVPYRPITGGGHPGFVWGWGGDSTLDNSILVDLGWNRDAETGEDQGHVIFTSYGGTLQTDYTVCWGDYTVLKPASGEYTTLGANFDEATNPYDNGLFYCVRVEPGSYLETAGNGGGSIGADVTTVIGRPGLFKGETDWNTEDEAPMWPLPLEHLLKEKFSRLDYTGPTKTAAQGGQYDGAVMQLLGARGFAAPEQALTPYIWGQMNRAVPAFNVRTFVSGSDVTVKWEPSQATEHRDKTVMYLVCRGDANGDNRTVVAQTTPTDFEYTETGLAAGTYTYWVETRHTTRGFSKHGYKMQAVVS